MLGAPSLALPAAGALSSERVLRLRDAGGEVGIQGAPLRGLRGGVCPSPSPGEGGVSPAARGQQKPSVQVGAGDKAESPGK